MEEVLKLATQVAEEAEVFSLVREETPVLFEANRLKHLQTRQSRGTALRIIKGGHIGFAATTKLGRPQELVDMAVEVTQFGAQARFQFPEPQDYPQIEVYDPAVETVSVEKMVELGESIIAKVRDYEPGILCEVGISKQVVTISLLNSRGGSASYKKTVFNVIFEGTLIRDTDMLFVGDSDSSCHPILDFGAIAGETLRQLELAKNTASISSGQLPVVFTPHGVASAIVLPLAMALNGKIVLQGASPLGNKLGQGVFDERLSVWDDATLDFCPTSRCCDDEGVLTQHTPLIQKGMVANFIYDLQTAGLAGTRSTGNGSRGLGSLPAPAINALIIDEGEISYEGMIKDMKEGLVVEMLMGAGQGNVLGGEFGGNVLLGYKVERGEIVGRVKNTMVTGNVYQALASGNLLALGRKARWVGDGVRTPALYLRSLGVASKLG